MRNICTSAALVLLLLCGGVMLGQTKVDLTHQVKNVLPVANGGTGNGAGTASNLSGTPALPNGTTATTQTAGDNTTKLATDAFVTTAVAAKTGTIASGTAALGTSAVASGACASVVTVTAAGVATTDVIATTFSADPTSTTGYTPSSSGMVTVIPYPTAGNVNFKVCNNTAASITPGAVTLNWRVVR